MLEASTPEHIKHAMSEILEIEAEAAKKVSMKPGLMPLLAMLRENKVIYSPLLPHEKAVCLIQLLKGQGVPRDTQHHRLGGSLPAADWT